MNDFFCPAPWRSIFFHIDKTSVCCMSKQQFDMSPSEFLNSDYLKNLKTKFVNGEYDPATCTVCKNLESKGLQSIRQHMLHRYGNSTEEILDYMELRASNLCNFECKMCNASNSSLIAGEVKNISDDNWNEVLDLSRNLKHLILTGGEPMLIKHYYELLDHLKDKTDLNLKVYTNASVFNPVFVEKMLKFDTTLNLSIDGVGATAEAQRVGTDWAVVKENIDNFLTLPIKIKFHITLSTISIVGVYSLSKYLVEVLRVRPDCIITVHTVMFPANLSITNLPKDKVGDALASIKQSLKILQAPAFFQMVNQLKSYKKILMTK
jgi:sulfatase maturation enzyme AslB (radical SAM superfamily)